MYSSILILKELIGLNYMKPIKLIKRGEEAAIKHLSSIKALSKDKTFFIIPS